MTSAEPPMEVLSNKCRICLVVENRMNQFFEPYFDDISLAEILKNISIIKLEDNNKLPRMICYTCTNTILSFKHFTKVSSDTEEYLKRLFCQQNQFALEKKEEEFLEDYEPRYDCAVEDVSDADEFKDEYNNFSNKTKEQRQTPPSPPSDNDEDNKQILKTEDFYHGENCQNDDNDDEDDTTVSEDDFVEVTSIKYSCELCGDCYLFKSGFSHHMLIVHNLCIQVNQYEQYTSIIKFKMPQIKKDRKYITLKKSPRIPTSTSVFMCRKCKEEYPTAAELKIHSEVHKTYRCDQCGAAFIRNSYLRDHLLKHSTDKCYACNFCGQKFKYRSALAVHKRDHVGNYRGHMCETCGRNFKEKGTLKTHIKLKHSNERNFSCSGCGLAFKLKAARDKHFMRKHTNNRTKDYVCSMCGMAYLNKETLTRHMNDKHTDVPSSHWCTVCDKTFTMRSNLLKHLRNKHNVITKLD